MNIKKLSYSVIVISLISCGGGGSSTSSTSNNSNTNNNSNQEPILTEKLIGTPFEGLTIGDGFFVHSTLNKFSFENNIIFWVD